MKVERIFKADYGEFMPGKNERLSFHGAWGVSHDTLHHFMDKDEEIGTAISELQSLGVELWIDSVNASYVGGEIVNILSCTGDLDLLDFNEKPIKLRDEDASRVIRRAIELYDEADKKIREAIRYHLSYGYREAKKAFPGRKKIKKLRDRLQGLAEKMDNFKGWACFIVDYRANKVIARKGR